MVSLCLCWPDNQTERQMVLSAMHGRQKEESLAVNASEFAFSLLNWLCHIWQFIINLNSLSGGPEVTHLSLDIYIAPVVEPWKPWVRDCHYNSLTTKIRAKDSLRIAPIDGTHSIDRCSDLYNTGQNLSNFYWRTDVIHILAAKNNVFCKWDIGFCWLCDWLISSCFFWWGDCVAEASVIIGCSTLCF